MTHERVLGCGPGRFLFAFSLGTDPSCIKENIFDSAPDLTETPRDPFAAWLLTPADPNSSTTRLQ